MSGVNEALSADAEVTRPRIATSAPKGGYVNATAVTQERVFAKGFVKGEALQEISLSQGDLEKRICQMTPAQRARVADIEKVAAELREFPPRCD